ELAEKTVFPFLFREYVFACVVDCPIPAKRELSPLKNQVMGWWDLFHVSKDRLRARDIEISQKRLNGRRTYLRSKSRHGKKGLEFGSKQEPPPSERVIKRLDSEAISGEDKGFAFLVP